MWDNGMSKAPLLFRSTRSVELERLAPTQTVTKIRPNRLEAGIPLLDAVEKGLAGDGGLFIPERFPVVDWAAVSASSFSECSISFLMQWLEGSLSKHQIVGLVENALNFDVPLVPLVQNGPDFGSEKVTKGNQNLHVLELFHGPTLSFKDFGARTLAFLLGARLRKTQQSITILVATSGDTGSAVADGLSGIKGIRVVLLYPASGVSEVQEKQLIVKRDGVLALRVNGTFDDCQRLIKGAFQEDRLRSWNLSTANSINIGRLIPQMLYYVWAVKKLQTRDVTFVVPSGNLGNLTAGIMAHKSGMPVARFIAAHNANDFFPAYLENPTAVQSPSIRTLSNAMDVGMPSNFERLKALLSPAEMRLLITGTSVSDEKTLTSMRKVYRESGYVADPHTSVGLAAAEHVVEAWGSSNTVVVLSTAHPAKFPDTIESAIGIVPQVPAQLLALASRPVQVFDMKPSQKELTEAILSHEWNR